MRKATLPTFAMLCAVPFVMVLSNSMLIPILPQIQGAMNLSLLKVGLIITAFSIPAGLTIPFAGCLSDRWGRKTIMVPALFLFGLGGLVAGLFPLFRDQPYPGIMAGRILQGIGAGGTYQLSMALTGDIFQSSERSKALGLLESANGLGKVLSPVMGSVAALITWYAPFYVYPLLAWPIALGVWLVVKEPSPRTKPKPLGEFLLDIRKVLLSKTGPLAAVFLGGFAVLFLLFGSLSYLSDVLEKAGGIEGIIKGVVIAGPVLVMTLVSYATGSVIRQAMKQRVRPASILGLTLISISMAVMAFFSSVFVIYGALVLLGAGAGLALPAINLLITGTTRESRGTLTALYGTVRFFGAALGPPALGLGLGLGRLSTFLTGTGLAVTGVILLLLTRQGSLLQEGEPGAS